MDCAALLSARLLEREGGRLFPNPTFGLPGSDRTQAVLPLALDEWDKIKFILRLMRLPLNSPTLNSTLTNPTNSQIVGANLSRVLIVEDELKLLDHLVEAIANEGHSTFTCLSYAELDILLNIPIRRFDVIVLDRLLNGKDSVHLIPKIKENIPDVKILIVSAIDTSTEKAQVLDMGADDYIAKPFDSTEMVARIRALIRRTRPDLRLGNVFLDSDKRTAVVNGNEVSLPNMEFLLLRTLLNSPGKIFSKAVLYSNVWEMSPDVDSNVVETTVTKLRRRLEDVGANIKIKSLRNKGYWVEE